MSQESKSSRVNARGGNINLYLIPTSRTWDFGCLDSVESLALVVGKGLAVSSNYHEVGEHRISRATILTRHSRGPDHHNSRPRHAHDPEESSRQLKWNLEMAVPIVICNFSLSGSVVYGDVETKYIDLYRTTRAGHAPFKATVQDFASTAWSFARCRVGFSIKNQWACRCTHVSEDKGLVV